MMQLPSDHQNIGLEKQQTTLPIMHFMTSKLQDYVEEGFLFQQNLKITHADPDHLFLAITQNWAMRLQGHILLSLSIKPPAPA